MHYNVVHAHSYSVDPNRVMAICSERDLKLRAYTISSRYEHWLFIFIFIEAKQRSEPTKIRHYFWTVSTFYVLFHAFYRFVTSRNIHSGVFISFRHLGHLIF
ncbi:hypothetical protein D3C78_1583760 [compost metagenome]